MELLGSGGPKRLAFDLDFAPAEFSDRAFQPWGRQLVILKPRAQLLPGARYRFSFRRRKFPRMGGPPRIAGGVQVLEVSVGTEALLPEAGPVSLAFGKQVIAPLEIRKGASCSTVITAAQQPLSFELPPSAEKWRDALLYSVTIDGRSGWRPARSNCADIPHGTSWVGPGRELLFVRCSGEASSDALPGGEHLVTTIAWLPGTNVFFKAERRVFLGCS
jgi:hypothetical protein